jgi:hypothetical protein
MCPPHRGEGCLLESAKTLPATPCERSDLHKGTRRGLAKGSDGDIMTIGGEVACQAIEQLAP